ncbi:splicing factor U2af large subunit A [Amborella trichopoda]|nr:splicing factor U2af large subunit A [Amborella trichopoda]|eukprot:XP_006857448.2 splicing factor U2af large subunit A [Amborella trichopoda]
MKMAEVERLSGKSGILYELSRNERNEGTSARTRPLTIEDLILRRNNKKLLETFGERTIGKTKKSVPETDATSDHSGSDTIHKRDSSSKDVKGKHDLDDSKKKGSSKKKNGRLPTKEDGYSKGKEEKLHRDKGRDTGGKNEKHGHHRGKLDDHNTGSKKHHFSEVGVKDRHEERDKYKKESKKKHKSESDEKYKLEKDGVVARKQEPSRREDDDYLEGNSRKKQSNQSSYHDETRPKRRRSESREPNRGRERRSVSLSPRSRKRTSYRGWGHDESTYYSIKERVGRHHSETERSRKGSNGSSSNGHYRRHGNASGLGGYSPRKRRSEAAVRTPSPMVRSPERKSAAWDLPPVGLDTTGVISNVGSLQSSSSRQVVTSQTHELPKVVSFASSALNSSMLNSTKTGILIAENPFDSVQLTQATRPSRRLYLENIPASASDESVVECLNNFLLSSGAIRIKGTHPCISCLINKEKGQALVEFLTPENATAALAFDGKSISGSIVKIRRPKDFIETPAVATEKPVATVDAVSDIVKDSPHKIFIGGIPKSLSSDKLQEIVSVFGHLKAYHFEVNRESGGSCAFLEYTDQSITLKACAGLNGMKLGGCVLTVVQAFPDVSAEEISKGPPSYGIPQHAKPLLKEPTQILKLKNVFNMDDLSESEIEESLEDIRIECTRFGTVKSVNIIRLSKSSEEAPNMTITTGNNDSPGPKQDPTQIMEKLDSVNSDILGAKQDSLHELEKSDPVNCDMQMSDQDPIQEIEIWEPGYSENVEIVASIDEKTRDLEMITDDKDEHLLKNKEDESGTSNCEQTTLAGDDASDQLPCSLSLQYNNAHEPTFSLSQQDRVSEEFQKKCEAPGSMKLEDFDMGSSGDDQKTMINPSSDFDAFQPGCVLVEYSRKEAACLAAHCLHGRLYGDHRVAVEYVAYDLYRARFPR